MGLQVWLPLTENLNNQGLANTTITNNGATIDAAGKIGKCYKLDGSSLSFPSIFSTNPNQITVCAWIKLIQGYAINNGCHLIAMDGNNFRICLSKDSFAVRVILYGSSFSETASSVMLDSQITYDKWYHIAVAINDKTVYIYINGELNSTTALSESFSSKNLANKSSMIGSYNSETPKAYMNDFRLYDNCLSAKEIREIYKGLILHYKLDKPAPANLLTNSAGEFSGTMPQSSYIDFRAWNNFTVNANEVYTLSYEAKASKDNVTLVNHFYNNTSGIVQCAKNESSTGYVGTGSDGYCENKLTTAYQKYWVRWTFNSTNVPALKTILFRFNDSSNRGETITVRNAKLEKGPIATPWIPNVNDPSYRTFGYTDEIEIDCSGFGNHGIRGGVSLLYLIRLNTQVA